MLQFYDEKIAVQRIQAFAPNLHRGLPELSKFSASATFRCTNRRRFNETMMCFNGLQWYQSRRLIDGSGHSSMNSHLNV
jgi:hypothetical protein